MVKRDSHAQGAGRSASQGSVMTRDDRKHVRSGRVSAFGSLARDVLNQLKVQHSKPHANRLVPTAGDTLEAYVLAHVTFDAADALTSLRDVGLTDNLIIDFCVPEVARRIGQHWVDDKLGFAEVTIASARLQSLLTEIEFLSVNTPSIPPNPYDILLVCRETEQHTLGSFVAAAQLRRRGAIVETLCGEPDALVKVRIRTNGYDAVMFSCSRRHDLDSIGQIAMDSKRSVTKPPPFILGGLVLNFAEQITRPAGIDLMTSDVEKVLEFCEERSKRPQWQAIR